MLKNKLNLIERIFGFAILTLTIFSQGTLAQAPEQKGLEVAQEVDKRDKGFGDTQTELTMILRNRQGEESTRQMKNKTLEVKDDGDKSLVIFNKPRDVKGTAFLSFTHKSGPDDQWLYLPALKRVKRIASNNKSGPFMGSEFAYEDISSQEVEKYDYKYIKDEQIDRIDCFVIEMYPLDKKSGYTKQIAYYDKEHYRPIKIVYYDRKNSLLKTLTYHDYNQYNEKFWRAGKLSMINHQTGKSTDLMFKDYEFTSGLSDRDFDKNSLKRAR